MLVRALLMRQSNVCHAFLKNKTVIFWKSYSLSTKRNLGITDKLMEWGNKKIEGNTEETFRKMIDRMTLADKWTLRNWKESFEDQLNSWRMYIPGASSAPGVQEIKDYKNIMEKMTVQELEDFTLINGAAKLRVSKDSGKSVDDVNKLLFHFRQTLIMSTWLKLK